jgi:hypothetical protein
MVDPDTILPSESDDELEQVEIVTAQQEPQDSAADTKSVKRKTRRVTDAIMIAVNFWTSAMETEIGRKEVWTLISKAHPFEQVFATAGGLPQSEASFSHAGRQAAGFDQYLHLLAMVPELTTLMLMENEPRLVAGIKAVKSKPRPRK